ncbi:urease accessory protein UreD [Noviherbaspirillum denitrificans]|uniref:Urease accessory protein UreD n=1 Tax=Noviherbaspirillum denitrificans TaxID=1968433 RepID=A0A254TFX3_9BURK|nr:urease accessory protein UreD [Noviherbaspirillum denitrificans]OWW21530.1 urease accessory protein UreD [Noviherbaspirillum denitrificans]
MRIAEPTPALIAGNSAEPWQAWLALGFGRYDDTTRLVERSHYGPLRVQKPLYPEGSDICHAIVVHPPGGVVGGDQLDIHACVGQQANAFITTPGAAKWYKANGRVSRQSVHLNVRDAGSLEWLPQETIFFDAAEVELDIVVELGSEASYIGCDILCFGRTASGEIFSSGRVAQRTSIRRDGKLVWFEQGEQRADAISSTLGMAGKTVCATLVGVGKPLPSGAVHAIREACATDGTFGVTQMKSVVVARYLGDSSETAKQLMTAAWRILRPLLTGRDAVVPRIWNT